MGSSGTPIFDASDGRLVGIIQYGAGDPKRAKAGLAYTGGTTIHAIKEAIVADAATAADASRKMFLGAKIELAEMYLALAQTRDATAAANLASARAEGYVRRGANLAASRAEAEASTHFATALQIDPKLTGRVAAAGGDAYVERGKAAMLNNKIAEADALFQQAHRKSPDAAKSINAAWAMAYVDHARLKHAVSLTWRNVSAEEVDDLFLQAHRKSPDDAKSINEVWSIVYVERGEDALRRGKTIAEADALFQDAHRKSAADAKSINWAWSQAHFKRGKALAHFRRAIEMDSNSASKVHDEYVRRDRMLEEEGRRNQAPNANPPAPH
jgi:tetratricopeptide (TPR) repeat protein